MIRAVIAAISLAGGALSHAGAQTTLVMRGRASVPAGQVVRVGAEGVTVAMTPVTGAGAGSTERVLSWDVVARVEGALSGEAAAYEAVAESMWRARSRVDRGDHLGAEPLFEELFAKYAGQRGPSAAVVAGGLLRCRLMEGAQTGAVPALLAYLNAAEIDQDPLFMPSLEPSAPIAVDGLLQISPLLPPIWVDLPGVQALARGTWPLSSAAEPQPRAAALQNLYMQAARLEAGMPAGVTTIKVDKDEGLALINDIVTARVGEEGQRIAARQALAARIKKKPALWVETWCRVGLGRSLLREPMRESQLLGISELLEVPARLERVNPYLTGIALAEAAVALRKLDDAAGATRLRTELSERFAGHPALEWDQLRSWPDFTPSKPAPVLPLPRTTSDDLDTKGGS